MILDKKSVVELIQHQCTTKNIRLTLQNILSPSGQKKIKADYQKLEQLLGPPGASEKVAHFLQE